MARRRSKRAAKAKRVKRPKRRGSGKKRRKGVKRGRGGALGISSIPAFLLKNKMQHYLKHH